MSIKLKQGFGVKLPSLRITCVRAMSLMTLMAESLFFLDLLDYIMTFNVLSIPFQQLIQNVGENANFGYSLEDLIKW